MKPREPRWGGCGAGGVLGTSTAPTPPTRCSVPASGLPGTTRLTAAAYAEPGWRVGVVMSERTKDGWAIAALTSDGMVFIEEAWSDDKGCDGKSWGRDELELLLDPGDLITWAGDGRTAHRVCTGDLRVLRKGAA